ncbi:hypothetical protein [Streptomyces sp. NPDC006012]|uniref:hypothetical protein n=1 Tax=Streptomyces sp. NPDC006012 TaxID=3364739 RepID=UPI00368A4F66
MTKNAPWPNAKTHRLFQMPERDGSQGQRLDVHPARTHLHTQRAGQPTQMSIAEGEPGTVSAHGQPCWTRPPTAAGSRTRPKACASTRLGLPQVPVAGGRPDVFEEVM